MIFTERIEKLLGSNQIKEVIDEFLDLLNDVPHEERDARNDANQLRGQVIILSGRFTDLNSKLNTNTIDSNTANQEKSVLINSFVQILNQIPSIYPDLNNYLLEKNEDDEWEVAQEKNSIEAYQFYFSKYPNGKYKAATITLIGELQDVKQKQDKEIKRLAKLEKERRAADKATETESQKIKSPVAEKVVSRQPFQGNIAAPAKSHTGLYVALGVLIGIILIIIIAVAVADDEPVSKASYNSTAQEFNQPVSGISESVKSELISAINLANSAEMNALYSLDKNLLYKSYMGEALKIGLTQLDMLRTNDLFMTTTLNYQEFFDFILSNDGQDAEVQLTQTWNIMYSRISTQRCYSREVPEPKPQRIFLKLTDAGWLISSVIHTNTNTPATIPCDN